MSEITIDQNTIIEMVEKAVEKKISLAVEALAQDPSWVDRIERQINQAVVQRTMQTVGSIDINTIVHQRVDENMSKVHEKLLSNFSSLGIQDRASHVQLTVFDEATVIENQLVAKNLDIVDVAKIKNLTVTGSINTDNKSWNDLSEVIANNTMSRLTEQWKQSLVEQAHQTIKADGIDFENITLHGEPLVDGNRLASHVTETNIQTLGQLQNLRVKGEAHVGQTLSVVNKRIGINTQEPEMALSVWDEEISVVVGKYKAKQAYVGTNRDQGLTIGTNRQPHIEIDSDGLTRIKKLQVGLHKISHDSQVPGWSGTRGDLVFNSTPGPDRVFAWVCLGAHKWQSLKSAE